MKARSRTAPALASAARWLCAALVVTIAPAASAHAQASTSAEGWEGRGFLTFSAGLQAGLRGFADEAVFQPSGGVNTEALSGFAVGEPARFDSTYGFKPDGLFDVGGGVRVWGHVGVGAAVSRFNHHAAATVAGQVPHPFFFDRFRNIAGESPLLARNETAVHLQALVVLPASRSLTVTFFGGPTVFNLQQDFVTDVRFTQAYPYDAAAFSGAVTGTQSASKVGVNVGVDLAYYFLERIGVGGLFRFSRADVSLPSAGGDDIDVRAGGLHAAGGLRVRF